MCPHSWFPWSQTRRMCRRAQRCSSNLDSQKATGWECGTLGFESETVCVNSATFLCQPSVLRQHRKSGWRVCNTDHTGWGKGLCSCRKPCRSLVSVVRGLLDRRAGILHALGPCQFGLVGLESADSIFHCMVYDVLHLGSNQHGQLTAAHRCTAKSDR